MFIQVWTAIFQIAVNLVLILGFGMGLLAFFISLWYAVMERPNKDDQCPALSGIIMAIIMLAVSMLSSAALIWLSGLDSWRR